MLVPAMVAANYIANDRPAPAVAPPVRVWGRRLARMSTSVSIAGFACRICRRALRRYRPDDESGS
jgi:hypothetical protein